MLNGGVIGFGRMGITHFSILNSHPEVRMTAIADTHAFVRHNARQYLGVAAYEDYGKMLAETDLHFVVVATPTASHQEIVAAALARGLHVFVEKPFTLDGAGGEALVSLAQRSRRVNQVGYVLRFSDVFLQVKQLLDGQALGDLVLFKLEMNGPTVLQAPRASWRARKDTGGGCLYDFASHAVDLAGYLFGPPDQVVGSVLQRVYSAGVEDAVSTTFVYRRGLRGNLLANWSDPSYRKPAYRLEVLGREGKIVADLHAYKVFFRRRPPLAGFAAGWNQRSITDLAPPCRFYLRGFEFTRQLDHFIDCIEGRPPGGAASFAEGLRTDALLARIREDAHHACGN